MVAAEIQSSELIVGDIIFPEFGPVTEIIRFFNPIAVRKAERRRNGNTKPKRIDFSQMDQFKKAFLAAGEEFECYELTPGSTHVRFANGEKRQFKEGEIVKIAGSFSRQQPRRRRQRKAA